MVPIAIAAVVPVGDGNGMRLARVPTLRVVLKQIDVADRDRSPRSPSPRPIAGFRYAVGDRNGPDLRAGRRRRRGESGAESTEAAAATDAVHRSRQISCSCWNVAAWQWSSCS